MYPKTRHALCSTLLYLWQRSGSRQSCVKLHILGSLKQVLPYMGFFFSVGGICSFLFPAQRLVGPLNWSGDTQLLLRNLLRPDKPSNHGTFTGKAQTSNMLHFSQMARWSHKLSLVSNLCHWNIEFILKPVRYRRKDSALKTTPDCELWLTLLSYSDCLYCIVKIFEDMSLKIKKEAGNSRSPQYVPSFKVLGENKSICEGDQSTKPSPTLTKSSKCQHWWYSR